MAKGKAKIEKILPLSETGKPIKQFFIQRLDKLGRTYFINQSGKKVSFDFVKKSKKRIFFEVRKKIGKIDAGSLIPKGRKKQLIGQAQNLEKTKISVMSLSINNVEIKKRIEDAIERGFTIVSQVDFFLYKLESKESKTNLLLFNFEIQEAFYNRLKPVTPSPFFNVLAYTSKKQKIFSIDFDSIELGNDAIKSESIEIAFAKFEQDKSNLNRRFFQK